MPIPGCDMAMFVNCSPKKGFGQGSHQQQSTTIVTTIKKLTTHPPRFKIKGFGYDPMSYMSYLMQYHYQNGFGLEKMLDSVSVTGVIINDERIANIPCGDIVE